MRTSLGKWSIIAAFGIINACFLIANQYQLDSKLLAQPGFLANQGFNMAGILCRTMAEWLAPGVIFLL